MEEKDRGSLHQNNAAEWLMVVALAPIVMLVKLWRRVRCWISNPSS